MKKRLLECLEGRPTGSAPVWLMRQAGRYLPEYRRSRERAGSFLALCKSPELACEVSLQPIERFPRLDAVIIFSDILTIPDAMGLGLDFVEGSGPVFRRPLREAGDIDALAVPDASTALSYTAKALARVACEMPQDKTLIGFCGSPWTIASYMCANGGGDRVDGAKRMLAKEPKAFERLQTMLSVACADYLYLQVQAGAEVVQIFDSWGQGLGEDWPRLSFAFIERIVGLFHDSLRAAGLGAVPVILYTSADESHYGAVADSAIRALSVPSGVSLGGLRRRFGDALALQGNLDPQLLVDASAEEVGAHTRAVLEDYGDGAGHILNLGHGITPQAKIGNVEAMLGALEGASQAPA